MRIRIDKADTTFSQYIRLRDMRCVRCFSRVKLNDSGLPVTHQCSHYFGCSNENTRFDPENCDTLCHGCHRIWENKDRKSYRDFKIKQLGEKGFLELKTRSQIICRKDRAMRYIESKLLRDDYVKRRSF